MLKRETCTISMDGPGRALDNIFVEPEVRRSVKYEKVEDIDIMGYGGMKELTTGLGDYFVLYNGERPHQSLFNRTPDEVYVSRQSDSALIVDKLNTKTTDTADDENLEPCGAAT